MKRKRGKGPEFKERAIKDGWEVRSVEGWYEAHNSRDWKYIVRKGYESPRRFASPRGAWSSIVGIYRAREEKSRRNAWRPGEIPYLGD